MHFLLGLIAYIVICYLVGKVIFHKDPDPDSRMRKGLIFTSVLAVLGIAAIIFMLMKLDENKKEKVAESYITGDVKEDTTPYANLKIKGIAQLGGDVPGLEITFGGEFKNLKSSELVFTAWFYFGEKGEFDNSYSILKDFNNEYTTTDGQVAFHTAAIILQANEVDQDSLTSLFIPISELHLQKNYKDINHGRILEQEKIKQNNRIAVKAGVFREDVSLDETDLRIYVVQ